LNGNIIVDDTDSVDLWHDAEEANWDLEKETHGKWKEWLSDDYAEEAHWALAKCWKDCKQWDPPMVTIPKPCPIKCSKNDHYPIGFPCALVLLSWIMWSMHSVGMMLKLLGMHWKDYHRGCFNIVHQPWSNIKEFLWVPPKPGEDKTKAAATGKKRLLMLGLLIAIKKAGSVPAISFIKENYKLSLLNKKRGKNGLLMTGKLEESDLIIVREAIAALPGTLIHKGDVKPVIVDTGCTGSASGDLSDFIPESLESIREPIALEGIGGSLQVTHTGTLRYEVVTDNGDIEVLMMPGMYMPELKIRLFSPQAYAEHLKETHGDELWHYSLNRAGSKFTFGNGKVLSIINDPILRLPTLSCFHNAVETAEGLALTCVTDERNQNLTNLQKTLLQWHFKLGHVGFQTLQWIG
jgi:hypothetical protein